MGSHDMCELMVQNDQNIKVKAITTSLYEEHGVTLPYMRVWRRKKIALNKVRGSCEDSYNLISTLCNAIKNRNPGSLAKPQCEEDHSFIHLFISFAASKMGFMNGCQPFIGLDGCHLKGKFNEILLSAIALDGNNDIFHLAFTIVEAKLMES